MTSLPLLPALALAACEGRKTQSRTIHGLEAVNVAPGEWSCTGYVGLHEPFLFFALKRSANSLLIEPPYTAGQRVPLLTSWAVWQFHDDQKPTELKPTNPNGHIDPDVFWHAGMGEKHRRFGKTRPGRFLPLTLRHLMPRVEIVSCVPQRLQDITESDAKSEGVKMPDDTGRPGDTHATPPDFWSYRQEFGYLIESIYPGAWCRNAWCWATTFKILP